jgi:hypothetical protein
MVKRMRFFRCFERLDEREGGISGFQGSGVLSQFIEDDDGVTPSMESAARKIRWLRVDRMLACRTFGWKATGGICSFEK